MSNSEYRVVDDYVTSESESEDEALEYQSEADKEERVVSSIKVLKRKITEVEEESPQETVIPTKKNKKTIDKEAEKVVQASTSSDISKKRYFKRQINKYKLRIEIRMITKKKQKFMI
ncbi:hypothetical protein BpHYR1_035667 [Brachionus plicatilis]|uniref:Uncharacterized protein n=1 Tax=Brachionus plicatilis TaxID=10195 RepID=A0A3M7R3D9_BRAPC|nr:hypothetical protein BpHYR1_035667 [Brachionus plicatilis]